MWQPIRFSIAVLVGIMMTITTPDITKAADAKCRKPVRYAGVIGLRAEKIAEYKELHAAIWPEVAKAVRDANIRNYSIYLKKLPDGNYCLFSYFEYVSDDFASDMAKLSDNADVRRWWSVTEPCQAPFDDRKPGEWWASMEEVFHYD